MKLMALSLTVAALCFGCARDHHTGTGGLDSGSQTGSGSALVGNEDSRFARDACQTGAAEMHIAKLAASNTRNEAVRSFAKKLAEDHAKAEQELSRLFARKNINADQELATHIQSNVDRLAELKGGAFDRAFKDQVIADHERAIVLFQTQAREGADPDLKAYAEKHLPHLRAHLEMARQLPISSDTDGPPVDSLNSVLQNPATRVNIPR